jgi:carbonic anhydrase/acetyltransferase-like protein (isoleucine patch superfamily)
MNYIEELKAKVKKENNVFIAPGAVVIGNVTLGENVSVWFNAVIRADRDTITIGRGTNIQDGCIIHEDPGAPVIIGEEVIIGHGAIIHGATIGNNTLIGMRATLLNHVKVGNFCVIGAHTLLPEGTKIPDYSVVMGSPGKVVKTLTERQINKLRANAQTYIELARKYRDES